MVPMPKKRANPNILVTGTPGVGKSTLCRTLATETGLKWLDISKVAKEQNFLEEFDEEYKCPVLDEERLLDYMEPLMSEGGTIIDYHSSEFFPERWFDIVFVLRTNNTVLYDRLASRGYSGKKLDDNVSCEIFQMALEEASNSYSPDIVVELESNTQQQLDDNAICIIGWINWWRLNNND